MDIHRWSAASMSSRRPFFLRNPASKCSRSSSCCPRLFVGGLNSTTRFSMPWKLEMQSDQQNVHRKLVQVRLSLVCAALVSSGVFKINYNQFIVMSHEVSCIMRYRPRGLLTVVFIILFICRVMPNAGCNWNGTSGA